MSHSIDSPVGRPVPNFRPPQRPGQPVIKGHGVTLNRLNADSHCPALFAAVRDMDPVWTYLGYGPFETEQAYHRWLADMAALDDPCFYAFCDSETGVPGGLGSFLRIDNAQGVIEIGHLLIAPHWQQTRQGSAAIMAMIAWAFDHGYRRVEWKCDSLNVPSRRAARRFGFAFEGIFRNHMIYKGRNRDTAWFGITDTDWPALFVSYERWLDDSNFDADGKQVFSLSRITAPIVAAAEKRSGVREFPPYEE